VFHWRFRWRVFSSTPQAGSLAAGARDVFGVAAAVLVDPLGRQFQHAIGERGEEVPVVGYEYCTGSLVE
jgi:hypothetical protein